MFCDTLPSCLWRGLLGDTFPLFLWCGLFCDTLPRFLLHGLLCDTLPRFLLHGRLTHLFCDTLPLRLTRKCAKTLLNDHEHCHPPTTIPIIIAIHHCQSGSNRCKVRKTKRYQTLQSFKDKKEPNVATLERQNIPIVANLENISSLVRQGSVFCSVLQAWLI